MRSLILGSCAACVFLLGLGTSNSEWIERYSTTAEVTLNQRTGNSVDFSIGVDETPVVSLVNDHDEPVRVRTVRFLNSRYIGQGSAALDDWYITYRRTFDDLIGADEWNDEGRVFHVGAPSQWSNFPGATDREGHPVQDTVLADLERFNIIIPANSTVYLGVANAAPFTNGFTFTMLTDRRLKVDDFTFTSTMEPTVRTVRAATGEQFKNAAINVEVVPATAVPVRR